MNSGARIMPIGTSPSLTERLFWPAVGLAVLALGGFVYLFYLMFGSHGGSPHAVETPTVVKTQQKSDKSTPKANEPAIGWCGNKMPSLETPAQNTEASSAAPSDMSEPVETAAKPMEKPDVDPYAVPSNKPYLTRDMFQPPKPQAPANAPKPNPANPAVAAKTPPKPAAAATPLAPPPSTAVTRPQDKLASPAAAPIHGKIYVLKDGRRISTVSTVDLGDSYGVKDLNSSYLTFPKSDVAEVIGR